MLNTPDPGALTDAQLAALDVGPDFRLYRHPDRYDLARLCDLIGCAAEAYADLGVQDVVLLVDPMGEQPQLTLTFRPLAHAPLRLATAPGPQDALIDFRLEGFDQARAVVKAARDAMAAVLAAHAAAYQPVGDFTPDESRCLEDTAGELYHAYDDPDDLLSERQRDLALRAWNRMQDAWNDVPDAPRGGQQTS